jgi:hypothetical protein
MDDFATAVDEDENSIYYDQRIPYSSWKLLKKVSNWEGLISVEYTDKELNFSNGKETVTLVDNHESFPFIDFFYNAFKYKWKREKDIIDDLLKTAEVDLTLDQVIETVKISESSLSADTISGTISSSSPYLNSHQIYDTSTSTSYSTTTTWPSYSYGLSTVATTDDLSQLTNRVTALETKINSNERKEPNTMNMFSALNLDFGPVASNIIRISPFGLAIKTANREWHTYDAANQKIVDVSDFSFSLGDTPILYKMPVAPTAVAVGDLILHNGVPVYVIDFENAANKAAGIIVIDTDSNERKTILPVCNVFNFNFVTKVVSLFNFGTGANSLFGTPSADQPFGNILPMMMMSEMFGKDSKSGDKTDIFTMMMMSQMFAGGANPFANMFGGLTAPSTPAVGGPQDV